MHGLSTPKLASDQSGAWAVAVTGDVLLRANPSTIIGLIGGTVGVNIIGGSIGARVSASGDLTVREQSVIGVQIVGGGASGDVKITPSTTVFTRIPVSGDKYITDGANQTVRATVKSYTNSNPQAVALVNASGDVYNPSDRQNPIISETKAGLNSTIGSRVIATAAAGKRLWVTRFEFQSVATKTYVHLAAGASGSQFTPRFILDPAFVGQVYASAPYPTGLFCTTPAGSLSIEMAGQNVQYAVTYFTGDA